MFYKFVLVIAVFLSVGHKDAAASESFMLSHPEVMMMKTADRDAYFRSVSRLLILLSPREQKTVFQMLWPDVHAAGSFRCIGGGNPVPAGGECGVQSYAGFSCPDGKQICNPFLFGVKPNGQPFCYKRATTELCYRNVIPGRNSVTDLVFAKPGNEEAYNQYVQDINNICHHVENSNTSPLVEIQERPATLRKACRIIRNQTRINRNRQLVGYTSETAAACEGPDCVSVTMSTSNAAERPMPRPNPTPGIVAETCRMKVGDKDVVCNSTTLTQRSWDGVRKMVCLYESSNLTFCPSADSNSREETIDAYLTRIEAAAEVMGLDRRQLACMTLIESGFNKNVSSSAGAKGIAQFMPGTANNFATRIQSGYGREWNEYQRKLGGAPFPLVYVTGQNISSGHASYGIFAMATYLKDSMDQFAGDLSGDWVSYLANGGDGMNLFHAQIAAYNWSPVRMDDFTQHVTEGNTMRGYGPLKRETEEFMARFNQCMYSESGWSFAGASPSAAKAEECGIHRNQGICASEKVNEESLPFEEIPVDESSGVF